MQVSACAAIHLASSSPRSEFLPSDVLRHPLLPCPSLSIFLKLHSGLLSLPFSFLTASCHPLTERASFHLSQRSKGRSMIPSNSIVSQIRTQQRSCGILGSYHLHLRLLPLLPLLPGPPFLTLIWSGKHSAAPLRSLISQLTLLLIILMPCFSPLFALYFLLPCSSSLPFFPSALLCFALLCF